MPEQIGWSRYLRKGFLTPKERVRYETRASKWYFFTWPLGWLLLVLLFDYWLGLARGDRLPIVPWLSYPGSHVHPAYLGVAMSLSLAVALAGWLTSRTRYLAKIDATSPRPEPLSHRYPNSSRRFLTFPTTFLLFSLLAAVVVVLSVVPLGAAYPWVQPFFLGLSTVRMVSYEFLVLTVLLVGWLLIRWAEWVGDSYVVTDDRLIKEHATWSILGRTYDDREIQIHQVRDIDLFQTRLTWRILGIGTLNIHSLSEIPAPPNGGREGEMAPKRVNPYLNPELSGKFPGENIDRYPGVEWWFAVPSPLTVQREIEEANEAFQGRSP